MLTPDQKVGCLDLLLAFVYLLLHSRLMCYSFCQSSALGHQSTHLLEQELATKITQSFEANTMFNHAILSQTNNVGVFPKTSLGKQLESVARTLAVKEQLGTNRQIFVVSMGGFDTHSGQAQTLPKLQSALDGALNAFNTSMESMGLANNVTLFTASDFGRTLAINGDGMVMGQTMVGEHIIL
ncbi:DUF1501 domain-containing protein [Pseudoalteromonas luteoviolacea]|uniref:DUF1501 domain-containing protein n=1 Tax=Pseudoalteromonas luteoviolacea S4054 TaxID=1129367 RepID=A0A0F6A5X4_9GAMM|nr:DUF1501 domain-containing protein [Pseudoalteromonas luteoviolacea]AOT10726.1 hypothetical protein S4054249_22995 [Pseudoalteromonas luteoviolacea]AOT16112.1 hypothetical protein S40542_25515 [Pseudoalteromonas luteoviolacea]AOT20546.1 hypothetical protein S4054_22910 [Pseudoalteromonas luteoviolacea]KKE81256.1 hypothetical protein N479_23030 [Pseudoalteromonas luteoviolacea S4054]KZN68981.1 hypothetical protein N481_22830 [Pseudoalteromonas luteoviolacea S4047-1]